MSVTIFLLGLHEAGMLAGATPEESFYVRCDLDNNPAQERDLGRMIIEIGVALVLPFEFVVMRVGRVRDSLEVRELGSSSAVGGAR
jgi:phage tail sheath protein FI